ncbi:MAG: DUF1116 domain-containing protein [Promethearchaeota archaeon]
MTKRNRKYPQLQLDISLISCKSYVIVILGDLKLLKITMIRNNHEWKTIFRRLSNQKNIQDEIEAANSKTVEIMDKGKAMLVDFDMAKKVIPHMTDDIILHAGPPIEYKDMVAPMKVAIQGGLIFEGRAKTLEEADKIASSGEITFKPCHEFATVGPMAGITTASMYVAVAENTEYGNKAFCNLYEGSGSSLRFGGFNDKVMGQLYWMFDVLGPSLKKVVKEKPIDLISIISQGLLMGDEFHLRSDASNMLFLKSIIDNLWDTDDGVAVAKFIIDNEKFFLNLSMLANKALADAADGIKYSTLVTRLTGNGIDFGIGVSGLKGKWFIGPAEVPKGLYFNEYNQNDAIGDFGDNSITETLGLGGYALEDAPTVRRLVEKTTKEAVRLTLDGYKVCDGVNTQFFIPYLKFKGTPLGINIIKVNKTGLVPKSIIQIVHKKAGIGQIGAGISCAPIKAFRDVLKAFAINYGIQ